MNSDELRALADALEPMARAPRFEDFDVPGFCAWVRACADAKPVAAGWKLVPVEPTPEMLSAVGMMDGYDWHAPGCSPDADHANWYSAMIAAAPAAPQAGQPIDLDAVAMQQMRRAAAESTWMPAEYSGSDWISDVCRWLRDGPPQAEPIDPHMIVAEDRFPDAQAEPKREPLSDERIAEIQRAAYERAAQECIETAAELRRCADGCTDGRYDWEADGALDCADAIRALGRQHD